jgi:hypothetical protein
LNKIITTSNNKAKATWEVIRNATGNGHVCTDVTYLKITGKNIQNYQNILNSFNNLFLDVANITKVGTNKDTEIDKRPMDYLYTLFVQPFPKLILKKMNCKEIEEIIRLMKPKSAHGYDGITANFIKASAPFISSPSAYICNKSPVYRDIPLSFKIF